MQKPKTLERQEVARQIKADLLEAQQAQATLEAQNDPDKALYYEGLIETLLGRLEKRRDVVKAARERSISNAAMRRKMRARTPAVWGFPDGYDPNLAGDRCEFCRRVTWRSKEVGMPGYRAWACASCYPNEFPDVIPWHRDKHEAIPDEPPPPPSPEKLAEQTWIERLIERQMSQPVPPPEETSPPEDAKWWAEFVRRQQKAVEDRMGEKGQ